MESMPHSNTEGWNNGDTPTRVGLVANRAKCGVDFARFQPKTADVATSFESLASSKKKS